MIEVLPNWFGNSWIDSPLTCTEWENEVINLCVKYPHRVFWALEQCNIIKSDTFDECHDYVDPEYFYDTCLQQSCGCDR